MILGVSFCLAGDFCYSLVGFRGYLGNCRLLLLLAPAGVPTNSIAFGNAPRREAESQPIPHLVRQAVSQTVGQASTQADRDTQFGFFQWQAGRAAAVRTSNGRMVMQPTADGLVGGLILGQPAAGSAGTPVISAQSDPQTLVQNVLSTNF